MADSLEDEAQAILAAMREAHASLPAVWEQSFSTWLEAITDDLQKSLERARRRKDARRVAELTNALDCIVPIREIRAQSPTGAELALHVVVLMEALAAPDLRRASRSYWRALKASQSAATQRQDVAAQRHREIRDIAATVDRDLSSTSRAELIQKRLAQRFPENKPLSVDRIRRILAKPDKK